MDASQRTKSRVDQWSPMVIRYNAIRLTSQQVDPAGGRRPRGCGWPLVVARVAPVDPADRRPPRVAVDSADGRRSGFQVECGEGFHVGFHVGFTRFAHSVEARSSTRRHSVRH